MRAHTRTVYIDYFGKTGILITEALTRKGKFQLVGMFKLRSSSNDVNSKAHLENTATSALFNHTLTNCSIVTLCNCIQAR